MAHSSLREQNDKKLQPIMNTYSQSEAIFFNDLKNYSTKSTTSHNDIFDILYTSGQIIIFHQPGFPWNKAI